VSDDLIARLTGADNADDGRCLAAMCREAAVALRARIAEMEREIAGFAKGVRVRIPTETMEAEFSNYHRLGFAAGRKSAEADAEKLAGLLREADQALTDSTHPDARLAMSVCPVCALQERIRAALAGRKG
jgi:flagellar biosynthesis/type III secretory pathway protein FliH